jgi:hypothetical protein
MRPNSLRQPDRCEPGSHRDQCFLRGISVGLRNGRESTDSSLCRAKREQVPPATDKNILWRNLALTRRECQTSVSQMVRRVDWPKEGTRT